MVGIEVGEHDVADILAAEAESVELVGRRLGGLEHRSGDEPDRPHPSLRIGAVVDSEAGVDEDQAVVGLHQQHMAYALGTANRVHGAAVEMVDLHRSARPQIARRASSNCKRAADGRSGHRFGERGSQLVPALPLDGCEVEGEGEHAAGERLETKNSHGRRIPRR